jgi:hypothetical protein
MKRLLLVPLVLLAGCGHSYAWKVNHACTSHGGVRAVLPTGSIWVHRLTCGDGTVEVAEE